MARAAESVAFKFVLDIELGTSVTEGAVPVIGNRFAISEITWFKRVDLSGAIDGDRIRVTGDWNGNYMSGECQVIHDQCQLTFATTDSYARDVHAGRETKNTPADHIRKFYSSWSAIKDRTFDGFIVTGVNALKDRVSDEDIWPEVQAILRWSETNVLSSLFLCWGAKAALKHFHDVESHKGRQKLFGLFEHRLLSDKTGLLFGFPEVFPVPVGVIRAVSRPTYNDLLEQQIQTAISTQGEGDINELFRQGDVWEVDGA